VNPLKQKSNQPILICAIATLILCSSFAHGAAITYYVDQGGLGINDATVVGTVETDGTIGTLAASNFLSWNLLLSDGVGDTFTLTPGNSSVTITGTATTATSSLLQFNYDTPNDGALGYFEIVDATAGWGWQLSGPVGNAVGGVLQPNPDLGTIGLLSFDPQPLTIGAVPEPSGFALFLTGFGVIGALRYAKRYRQRS
jgi:hypothetical protein